MKKWILLLIVLLVVVCASGCTKTQTFNGSGVTFQYPQDWSQYILDEVNPSRIAALETPKGNNSTLWININDTGGRGLEEWKNIGKGFLSLHRTVISEGSVQIAGVDGYRIDSTDKKERNAQYVDIFFVKNGKFYYLMFGTGSITDINGDINTIVNSFQTT